jgi:hypothetical protein
LNVKLTFTHKVSQWVVYCNIGENGIVLYPNLEGRVQARGIISCPYLLALEKF